MKVNFLAALENLQLLLKGRKRESFDRTFSKVRGFLRQSLKSPSADGEISLVLRNGAALGDIPEGVNHPAGGMISLLHP
jgi:hypothetical protein